MTKTNRLLKKSLQFALDSVITYETAAERFSDLTYSEPMRKTAKDKQRHAEVLQRLYPKTLKAGRGDAHFMRAWSCLFGKKSMLKNMAGAEKEQGDRLRVLAKEYPELRSLSKETYLHSTSMLRLRDRLKHKRKKR